MECTVGLCTYSVTWFTCCCIMARLANIHAASSVCGLPHWYHDTDQRFNDGDGENWQIVLWADNISTSRLRPMGHKGLQITPHFGICQIPHKHVICFWLTQHQRMTWRRRSSTYWSCREGKVLTRWYDRLISFSCLNKAPSHVMFDPHVIGHEITPLSGLFA